MSDPEGRAGWIEGVSTGLAGFTRPDPVPLPTTELTLEPFIGYRLWKVTPGTVVGDREEQAVLSSAVIAHHWETAEQVAVCTAASGTPATGRARLAPSAL